MPTIQHVHSFYEHCNKPGCESVLELDGNVKNA